MKNFRSLLVHIDTRVPDQPVLRRAVQLTKQHNASLTVVDVVPDVSWAMRMTGGQKDFQRTIAEKKREALDRIVAELQQQGVAAQSRVLIGNVSVELIAEVERSHHDLVMKDAKGADSKRPGFFGTTATRLMRFCPCAVWAFRPAATGSERVLAAVDATAEDQRHHQLNHHIVETAVALNATAKPHVVHAWSIYGENLIHDYMKRDEFDALVRDAEQEATSKTAELLRPFGIGINDPEVHLLRGVASDDIADFVTKEQFDVLVMGTVARSGVSGFLIGNTAEMLLQRVACSIVAVKLPS